MLGIQKKSNAQTKRRKATRHATHKGHAGGVGGIYAERANQPTQEWNEGKDGVMETRRPGHRGASGLGVGGERASVGAAELGASSRRVGEATAVRQRPRAGRAPGDLLSGNARPGQLRAGRAGARGPGRPNKAGARGAWLLTTRSSCRPRRGLRARRSLGLRAAAAARDGERRKEERRRKASASCSTAATCSALLVPMAGGGGGSGKRTP